MKNHKGVLALMALAAAMDEPLPELPPLEVPAFDLDALMDPKHSPTVPARLSKGVDLRNERTKAKRRAKAKAAKKARRGNR
tara:strand:+ start:248 stop:490 length:243 start_codon:yes stop_codon:yes gene_type:complete